MIRLLFVSYLHGFGGAEKQIIMLANAMAKKGHDVHLISLSENNPCYQIEENVDYFYQIDAHSNRILNIIDRYVALKKAIQRIEPELIIHFNMQSAYMCAFMGGRIPQKTIYAERGDPYDKEYSGLLGSLRKYMSKRIGGFVFQTKGAQDFFPDYVKRKSVIINNPVFINMENNEKRKSIEKRIVNVGRLHEQKNQKLLIKAMKLLPSEYDEYILEIYGEGELRPELEDLINELELSNRVNLLGTYKDVVDRIKNATVFVLSSDFEGMPNALAEAMALGVPCISTDCRPGGARELIISGENGIITPVNDAEKLADAISVILSSSEIQRIFSENAKKRMRELTPDKIYRKWETFFLQMVNK